MGQKVHPIVIRLGIVKEHTSVWYADNKNYAQQLITDLRARAYIGKVLDHASVSRVVIERPAQTARITIHTARPGGKSNDPVHTSPGGVLNHGASAGTIQKDGGDEE